MSAKPQQQTKGSPLDGYVTVAGRIEAFYERFPDGRITTYIIEHDAERGFILMRAEVYRRIDDAQPAASGHAYEYRDGGYVQKTSYIEVGETSAVGRALALCGFETKRGLSSREDLERQTRQPQPTRPMPVLEPDKPASIVERIEQHEQANQGDEGAFATKEQIAQIRSLAADRNIDIDAKLKQQGRAHLEACNSAYAAKLIDWLISKPIPEKEQNAVTGFTLTKEEWIAKIGDLWRLLLDLKAYPNTRALEESFVKACKGKKRSELTAEEAMKYIQVLKGELRIAEEKIPVGGLPAESAGRDAAASPLTQPQYSEIGRLADRMIALGLFDDRSGLSLFMKGKVGVHNRGSLTESHAAIIIRSLNREIDSEAMRRQAALSAKEDVGF